MSHVITSLILPGQKWIFMFFHCHLSFRGFTNTLTELEGILISWIAKRSFKKTPLKFNMEPENDPHGKGDPF